MQKGEKKLSPFIERKVRTWYRLTNKNKTGYMDRSDFNKLADSFILEYSLDDKTGGEIRGWLVDGWDTLIKYTKTETPGEKALLSPQTTPFTLLIAEKISKGERINEDLYINAYSEVLKTTKDLFPTVLGQMVTSFFNVFDTNHDGLITEADMIRGLKCFGIDKTEVLKNVFAEMDKCGNGNIDLESYISAWVEFMTGSDENAPMAKYIKPDIL